MSLLAGLAEGIKSFNESYDQARARKMKEEAAVREEKRQTEAMNMGLIDKGLQRDPNQEGGFIRDPGKVKEERFKQDLDARGKGLIVKRDAEGNPIGVERDPAYKDLDTTLKNLQIQKELKEQKGGRALPAGSAEAAGGAQSSYKAIDDVTGILSKNKDITGPGAGLLSKVAAKFQVGERGRQSAALDAELRSRAQTVGKYLEGGKMTDSDIARYEKMLPTISDSPEVADRKVQNLKNLIAQKQQSELDALGGAGYDVAGVPKLKSGGAINDPATAVARPSNPQDMEAISWAKANPKDPRSAAILKANGM